MILLSAEAADLDPALASVVMILLSAEVVDLGPAPAPVVPIAQAVVCSGADAAVMMSTSLCAKS